jgi:hypothetical protein
LFLLLGLVFLWQSCETAVYGFEHFVVNVTANDLRADVVFYDPNEVLPKSGVIAAEDLMSGQKAIQAAIFRRTDLNLYRRLPLRDFLGHLGRFSRALRAVSARPRTVWFYLPRKKSRGVKSIQ